MFTINSITAENISTGRVFYSGSIVGNVGEKVRITIELESTEVPNMLTNFANSTLQYVLKSNQTPPYGSGSPTLIPTSFFQNIHSSGVATITDNRIVGTSLTSFVGGKHGQIIPSESDFIIALIGGNVIRYQFDMYILPALLPSDFVGGTFSIPTYFASTNCLTLYFQAGIYEPGDIVTPTASDDTRDLDLSSYFDIGNTGYFNEAYNVGSEFFNLSTWTPPAVIDPTLTQTYTAQITRTSLGAVAPALNFVANSQIKVMLLQLKDDNVWDVNKTYIENIEFHVLDALANNTPVATSKIIDFTANAFSVDTVNISFKILANALTPSKKYVLWFNVGVESTDGFWTTQNTQPHLLYGEQGSSLTGFSAEMYFSHWDKEPPAPLFNGLRSFRSDDGVAYCQINNTDAVTNAIQSFTFGFKSKTTNVPIAGELFTVPITSLPYTQTRSRIRNTANERNYIYLTEISPNNYQLKYGFQAWDGWADASDYVFFCAANVVSNGIVDVIEYQSPFIQVGQFATTKNSASEPQALPLTPQSVEFYICDIAGNIINPSPFPEPIFGQNNLIVGTWKDNNLNDLQTTETIGYLGVCAGTQKTDKNRWRYIFTQYDTETDTPFIAPVGHTFNRAKAEVISIDTAQVSAVLLWSEYVRIFGDEPACFDFRLDKLDPPAPVYATQKYLIWHFRNDQDYCEIEITEPIGFIAQFTFNGFFGAPPAGTVFKINGGAISYSAFLVAIPSLVPTDIVRIEVQTPASATPYGTDWVFSLLVGTFSVVAAGFKDYEIQFVNPDIAQPNVGCDALLVLNEMVEFNTNPAAHNAMKVGLRVNPPSVDDYTTFNFDLKDAVSIGVLNSKIASLGAGTIYGLHFWAGINKTSTASFPNAGWSALTSGNQNQKFSYRFVDYDDTREILAYKGETSQPRYAFKLGGDGAIGNQVNGLKYDGASTYQLINNFPTNLINNGSPFTIHLEFFVDNVSDVGVEGYRTIFATEYQDIGGARVFYIVQKNGFIDIGFGVGVNQSFNCFAPIKTGHNTLIFSYDGRDNVTGGAGFTVIINGFNGFVFSTVNSAPTAGWSCWTGLTTRASIGTMYLQGYGAFGFNKGKVKNITVFADPALVLPIPIENRTMTNDKGTGDSPFTQGEPYAPFGSAFYMITNFGKSGIAPITFDTNAALAVLMQGATVYDNYLNP